MEFSFPDVLSLARSHPPRDTNGISASFEPTQTPSTVTWMKTHTHTHAHACTQIAGFPYNRIIISVSAGGWAHNLAFQLHLGGVLTLHWTCSCLFTTKDVYTTETKHDHKIWTQVGCQLSKEIGKKTKISFAESRLCCHLRLAWFQYFLVTANRRRVQPPNNPSHWFVSCKIAGCHHAAVHFQQPNHQTRRHKSESHPHSRASVGVWSHWILWCQWESDHTGFCGVK